MVSGPGTWTSASWASPTGGLTSPSPPGAPASARQPPVMSLRSSPIVHVLGRAQSRHDRTVLRFATANNHAVRMSQTGADGSCRTLVARTLSRRYARRCSLAPRLMAAYRSDRSGALANTTLMPMSGFAAVPAEPYAGKYRESCWITFGRRNRRQRGPGSSPGAGVAARDCGTDLGGSPRALRVGLLSARYLADLAERSRRHWHGIRHTRIRRYANGRRARTVHDPPG
jgi:hypothetical protein